MGDRWPEEFQRKFVEGDAEVTGTIVNTIERIAAALLRYTPARNEIDDCAQEAALKVLAQAKRMAIGYGLVSIVARQTAILFWNKHRKNKETNLTDLGREDKEADLDELHRDAKLSECESFQRPMVDLMAIRNVHYDVHDSLGRREAARGVGYSDAQWIAMTAWIGVDWRLDLREREKRPSDRTLANFLVRRAQALCKIKSPDAEEPRGEEQSFVGRFTGDARWGVLRSTIEQQGEGWKGEDYVKNHKGDGLRRFNAALVLKYQREFEECLKGGARLDQDEKQLLSTWRDKEGRFRWGLHPTGSEYGLKESATWKLKLCAMRRICPALISQFRSGEEMERFDEDLWEGERDD